MRIFFPYPSIGQFRDAIKQANKKNSQNTVLEYTGTVKLHGTNASIVGIFDDKNNLIDFYTQ